MKKTRWFTLALALVLLVALLAVPATTSAGNPVGGMFLIRDEPAPVEVRQPAVAYNSQVQEYLVAWYNDLPGNDDIHVERVSRDGKLLKHTCVACGVGAERRYPDVAYNSQANEYLVVWEEDNLDIRGQRVSATGGLTGGAFDIALGTIGTTYCVGPAIAYASTEDKYLVAFEWRDASGYRIMAQALNSDGSAWGTVFDVEPYSLVLKAYPDLAYNHLRNEFLVAWEQRNGSQFDIRGRRVKMSGGAGTLGNAFWVSNNPNDDMAPAVAAVPRAPDGQYLVTWEYWFSGTDGDIWAQRVSGGGGLEGGPLVVLPGSYQNETNPAVTGSGSNQQYLVVWKSPVGLPPPNPLFVGIFGRSISTGGTFLSEATWMTGLFADYAAVASGPVGDTLIAFEDTIGGGKDLWGQLWGNRLYLPLVLKNH
jgi:hypothetical protein